MRKHELTMAWEGNRRTLMAPVDPDGAGLPWRTTSLKDADAFSAEDVATLAARFELEPEFVETLGIALSAVLDPSWTAPMLPVDASKGWRDAKRLFEERIGDADPQDLDWMDLEEVFRQFHVDREACPALWSRLFDFRHEELGRWDVPVEPLIERARNLLQEGEGKIVLPSPVDRRRIGDVRRRAVIERIVAHWREAGRKATWTTDVGTYDRQGRFLEFVVEVVKRLTKPSAIVPNETIVGDLKRLNRRRREDRSPHG